MKTKLLSLFMLIVVSVFYSCTKDSDTNATSSSTQDNSVITSADRRFIISNCSGHGGCHGGAKVHNAGTISEVNFALRNSIESNHTLSICERSKMQGWMNGEVQK